MQKYNGTVVIGAGVVGLAIALRLARQGIEVTVLDPLPPGSRASFGNAGIVNPDTVMPMAGPGTLRKVPGLLTDKQGPLMIAPGYFLRLLPWLARYLWAGTPSQVRRISVGMHQLHRSCAEDWELLIGSDFFAKNMVFRGALQLGLSDKSSRSAALGNEIRQNLGIASEYLDEHRLREIVPDITPKIKSGLLLERGGFSRDPAALCQHLALEFQRAGGLVLNRSVERIDRRGANCISLVTNLHSINCSHVVVAAGVWSRALVAPLGINVPLEAERGYHAILPDHNIRLDRSVSFRDRGFSVSPMNSGLRVAGTVEFSGLNRPPDMARAQRLVEHAKELFPGIDHGTPHLWAGYRPSMPDSLPIIGPATEERDVIMAFGHSHYGMSGAPGTARIVAQMIQGNRDPSFAAYSHTRF